MRHYLHTALLAADGHAVTVDLIGAGGTGSSLLTHLARLNRSLRARGHLGLHVRVFDPDIVEESNLVRQHYTEHDLGRNKAEVAVERLNRFHGLNWQAFPLAWNEEWARNPIGPLTLAFPNLIISCVDTVKARRGIVNAFNQKYGNGNNWPKSFDEDGSINVERTRTPVYLPLYWLDIGNARDVGQVVLGTFRELPQPTSYGNEGAIWGREGTRLKPLRRLHPGHEPQHIINDDWQGKLPHVFDVFPDLENHEDETDAPSCSLVEALSKQSIMINPMMATAAANLLSQLFEQTELSSHGCFVNLKTMSMVPIPIKETKKYSQAVLA